MSHHNVSIGNDRVNLLPTDLARARANAELVQKGFYNKEPLELANAYQSSMAKNVGTGVQPLDPRIANGEPMLGTRNAAVAVNPDLMAEIEYAS